MKITNPTDQEIGILYKGVVYNCPANGSVSDIPSEVAIYWQTMIHNFITIEPDGSDTKVESKKEKKVISKVDEVTEE